MRQNKLAVLANRYIQDSPLNTILFYKDGDVEQIIKVIQYADRQGMPFTVRFAKFLKEAGDDMRTLKGVWSFTRRNITYRRDEAGHEKIKSPGATWKTRVGDCKSMSVFIGSILKNLGYKVSYRVAFYDKDNPQQGHIYPIAHLPNGKRVVVDAVNPRFNHEYPIWKAYDYEAYLPSMPKLSGFDKPKWPWKKLAIGTAIVVGLEYYLSLRQKESNDEN